MVQRIRHSNSIVTDCCLLRLSIMRSKFLLLPSRVIELLVLLALSSRRRAHLRKLNMEAGTKGMPARTTALLLRHASLDFSRTSDARLLSARTYDLSSFDAFCAHELLHE